MSGDPVRVAQVGLGAWGQNLVRNLDVLGELTWICDDSDARRETFARRFPNAMPTNSYEELLADTDLEAVVIATPVPTHYALAKQALEAGKHVFVEKPPSMRAAEMEELVELSEARGKVLMPGHLLLYHPGVRKLKELVDTGDLGEVLCIYGNRQNLGTIRKDENALWSLGVHDVSVILHLADEEPSEVWARGNAFLNPGVEDVVFCFLRFPSGKIAHLHLSWLDPHKMRKLTVVGRDKMAVFDDMELERKVTIYEKWPEQAGADLRRVADAHGRHPQPEDPHRRAAATRALALPAARARGLGRGRGARRARRRAGARAAPELARDMSGSTTSRSSGDRPRRGSTETAVVYPGTVLGEGVKVLEHAVVGKQPALSPRSTAKREPLPPVELGDGTIVSTGAVVFAGSTIGARVILGDQSCVRERVTVGDDVVLGRGSIIENDTTVGAMTKIQAEAYITAYSTLEEHVFIAPCVVTSNDNLMGRTERRHDLIEGPTIRRGARIGAGAVLCPAVEIGEEAFVGAGAVVTKDVPARTLVVGNPARKLRDVPRDELLPG